MVPFHTMRSLTFFATFVIAVAVKETLAKCEGECKFPVKHYEELGCKPEFGDPENCCPTNYVCDEMQTKSIGKCLYQGKEYDIDEKIDDNLTKGNCAIGCQCLQNDSIKISCSIPECGVGLGSFGEGCYPAFESDSCCPSKKVCPPYDRLATCEFEGTTFHEGQRFWPEGKCMTCTCQPGFTGKLEEKFCKPINCGTELWHSLDAKHNCVPVYHGSDVCCPIQWKCPTDEDKIVPGKTPTTNNKTCSFGNQTLNVGDKLVLKKDSEYNPDVDCECRIPPLVTCVMVPIST